MFERIVIVGGGVLGTMHAYFAHRLGVHVVHIERDAGPRGASVRRPPARRRRTDPGPRAAAGRPAVGRSGDVGGRGRPYPDMILTSILRLSVDNVRDVAVVGDTGSDVKAGLASGASIVAGVRTGAHNGDRLLAAGATHVLDGVTDLVELLRTLHQ